jgi:phosphatidylserine/phosphatidylglycerophosphate/cardiolipin synthase-like enzyme
MKLRQWRWLTAVLLLCGAVAFAREPLSEVRALPAAGNLDVYFPPWDDAQAALLATLDAARTQVLVQAFLLTNRKIADSLIAALLRGLDVRVLADAKQHADNPGSLLAALARAGVPVWLETRYKNAHNKVMVIDAGSAQAAVMTGSFNFTWSAQNMNAENLLIIRGNTVLADRFASNWMRHRADAISLESQ